MKKEEKLKQLKNDLELYRKTISALDKKLKEKEEDIEFYKDILKETSLKLVTSEYIRNNTGDEE